jgi:hypothetical protein
VSRLKYTIKGQISSGSFGTIYEVLSDVNKVYALKELTIQINDFIAKAVK